VAGTVTASSGGGGVAGVNVDVYDGSGNFVAQVSTDGSGDYSVTGLLPSATGYTVCFDASAATGGSSTTGCQSQCYSNVPWVPGQNPPSGATAVPLSAGQVAAVNAALAADGGISGTVTAASGGGGVTGVNVDVYDSSGNFVTQAVTDSPGHFSAIGLLLSTTGYTVCFDASAAGGGSSTTGYQSQWYQNVPWIAGNGPPCLA